jgi:predicted RNA-binding Zn-ribbon protein involved in translation (DUF1610 family)
MFTANGRVSGSKKEKATKSTKGKEFRCTNCGVLRHIAMVEFGEKIKCLDCGSVMTEIEK